MGKGYEDERESLADLGDLESPPHRTLAQIETPHAVVKEVLIAILEVCLSPRYFADVSDEPGDVLFLEERELSRRAIKVRRRELLEFREVRIDFHFQTLASVSCFIFRTKKSIAPGFSALEMARSGTNVTADELAVDSGEDRLVERKRALAGGILFFDHELPNFASQKLSSF